MEKSNKNHILMRYLFVVIAMLVFSGCIIYSMFKTTVVYAHAWNQKADAVWKDSATIQPERGKILADNGAVLAANIYFYVARVDWGSAGIKQEVFDKGLPALCDSLAAFDNTRTAKEWKEELLQAKEKVNKKGKKDSAYRLIKRQLTHAEYLRLCTFPVFNKCKRMLYSEREMRRSKPFGKMAARSIGNVHKDDSTKAIHGITGLENALDSLLYGVAARVPCVQLNVNTANWGVAAVKGYDVTTTINIQLQDIVEEQLYNMLQECNGKWGTAILMKVNTGEIKAISNLDWSEKSQDYIEGENHAVLGYEPGSVMKPISMMVALEDGIVKDIHAPWQTGSVWSYAGGVVKDDHGSAPSLTPCQIIERSSNIGMSKIIAQRYGSNPDGFRQRLEGMGFFEPMNMGIAGQRVPRFLKLGNANRDRIALTRTAFGYTTEIPPMSVLAMFNAFANDGKYVCPRLVSKLSREGEPDSILPIRYIRKQVCSPENAQKMRAMLHEVVWGQYGTAHKTLPDSTVHIAGKTGTAYIVDATGHYSSLRRLAFCGFFPEEKPLYTCMVLIYGGNKGAAYSSAVVLKNIALKMYARGLLDNKSDYTKGNTNAVTIPRVSATNNANRSAELRAATGLEKTSTWANMSNKSDKGVPNVVGLSVRDAVAKLEKLGLVVKCTGAGYVARQNLPPGSVYKRGDIVRLYLTNRSS